MLEIAATVLTIISIYCMTNDKVEAGWVYGICGNMAWIVYGGMIGEIGIMLVNGIMFVLYLRSIIKEFAYV